VLAATAALVPVTLGRYDLSEHQVLSVSGVVVLVGFGLSFATLSRTPEWTQADEGLDWPRWVKLVGYVVFAPWVLAITLIPVVILLGVAPDLDAALYFTDVVLILFWTAVLLLQMVFRGRPPAGPDRSVVRS
jgi:hypothetical protein